MHLQKLHSNSFSRLSFSGEKSVPSTKMTEKFVAFHNTIHTRVMSHTCHFTSSRVNLESITASQVYTLRRVKSMSQTTLSLRSTLKKDKQSPIVKYKCRSIPASKNIPAFFQ